MKQWHDFGFKVELTADQSPTLRLLQSQNEQHLDGESMHHSGGAWSETLQIYGRAIDDVYQKSYKKPEMIQFVVVGLGLGYIELLIAQLAEKHHYPTELIQIMSFESVPELRDYFIAWLNQESLPFPVASIYDQVASFVGEQSRVQLNRIFKKGNFKIQGALSSEQLQQLKSQICFSGLFYDAFSSKTNPELWEEDFLKSFIALHHPHFSVLATYASKGTLKRALKFHHFLNHEEKGFQGKRNSTYATYDSK